MSVTAVRSAFTDQPVDVPPSARPTAADELLARTIGALLLRRDSKNPRAILEDLDARSQEQYIGAAMVAIRGVDPHFQLPALYAAADAGDRFEGGTGLNTMHRDVRIHELGRLDAALRAYRTVLASDDPSLVERFRKAAEADRHKT